MNSPAKKLSKCLAAIAFVTLAPLAHAAPTPIGDFDGTLYLGLLDQFNDTVSISVGGFAAGGSYTFSFALNPGDDYNSSNLGLVFADFGPDTQDNFGLSVDFTAGGSGLETLTFDYFNAGPDLDFVDIFNGLIVCTNNCTPVTPVPEPGTMALVGLALAGMGFAARRRKTA